MTLIIQKPTTSKLILAKGYPNDPDVLAYIAAVQAADETASPGIGALEIGTVKAIDDFVTGCKSDEIWTAIKASCILAGARTLTGALVPLAGTAPTNNNFVSGDYNRKTGLVGNESTKYLNSNRNNDSDPQDNAHLAVHCTEFSPAAGPHIGVGITGTGATHINQGTISLAFRNRASTADTISGAQVTGFIGMSRSASGSFAARALGSTTTFTRASQSPQSGNIHVFNRNGDTVYGGQRLSFYSIGESLDLALLDARVTDLINAFAAAIP
jgi:hypothetical protein